MLFINWALCYGFELIECLNYIDAHGALCCIAWTRIAYAESEACDEIVRECVSAMSM